MILGPCTWEARRLLGQEDILSPRHAFIHAVAGQPPRGYERVVLAAFEFAPDGLVLSEPMVVQLELPSVSEALVARLASASPGLPEEFRSGHVLLCTRPARIPFRNPGRYHRPHESA